MRCNMIMWLMFGLVVGWAITFVWVLIKAKP